MKVAPVRTTPDSQAKISGRSLHSTPFPQQTLPLALGPSQDLDFGFLSDLGLGVRAIHVLLGMELKTPAHFTALDRQTLLRRRNCGKKTAAEIMDAVAR